MSAAGISVKHLSSGHVHIIAASERGTVRLTVTREYARKVATQLLGDMVDGDTVRDPKGLAQTLIDMLRGKP